jgi:SAM-dependent methyltransferase
MPTWETIYQNYQQGGPAWASLADGLVPSFLEFIYRTNFTQKTVLDVGCGQGQYLQWLAAQGWQCAGIDNSPTALAMAKASLPASSSLIEADMFSYGFPHLTYDLVISIAALNHGYHADIAQVVRQMIASLKPGGWLFLTLPSDQAREHWETFREAQQLVPGVWAPTVGPEAGLPHSFFSRAEMAQVLDQLSEVTIELDDRYRWVVNGQRLN